MIVIDASVALKWIITDEQDRDQALFLQKRHIEGQEIIIVPDLLFIEVANALVTKSKTSPVIVANDMKLLFQTALKTERPTEKDLLFASKLAKRYNTTVYDMLYAVMAKNKKTQLVTADDNFLKKTNFKFVKLLRGIEIDGNGKQNTN